MPNPTPFGFINAFKPPGPSSAAFGSWVRHLAGGAPVGHWGTLDPRACGVLVLAVGKATKLLPLMPDARKQYVFELIVGTKTDSADATGRVTGSESVPDKWRNWLDAAARSLIGPTKQVPPMHSAVKIDGKPLYRSARAGVDLPRAPRATEIYELRYLPADWEPANSARLFVSCAAGTYVRVLCEELGRSLGLPAHMGALLRVASGSFLLQDSALPTDIARDLPGCLLNPLSILPNPKIELDEQRAHRFIHGNEVLVDSSGFPTEDEGPRDPNGEFFVFCGQQLLGCGQIVNRDGRAQLVPTRVLTDPTDSTDLCSGATLRRASGATDL